MHTRENAVGRDTDFFDGDRLEAADLESEQDYRRRPRYLRRPVGLVLALAAIGLVVARVFRGRSRSSAQASSREQLKHDSRAEHGRPRKWDGPTFNAKGNDVAIEERQIDTGGDAQTNEPAGRR